MTNPAAYASVPNVQDFLKLPTPQAVVVECAMLFAPTEAELIPPRMRQFVANYQHFAPDASTRNNAQAAVEALQAALPDEFAAAKGPEPRPVVGDDALARERQLALFRAHNARIARVFCYAMVNAWAGINRTSGLDAAGIEAALQGVSWIRPYARVAREPPPSTGHKRPSDNQGGRNSGGRGGGDYRGGRPSYGRAR